MSLRRFAVLALAAGSIAGCGEGGGSPSTTSTGATGRGATDLAVTLDADGEGGDPPLQESVSCPGPDEEACEAVAGMPDDAAAQVPPQTACTEIYGGPDTLVIQGKLDGESVDARLVRTNGCEIERFDRFVPLLKALFAAYEPGSAIRG